MKKFIIITVLCFFSTFSYGQTKEETISWLNQKLKSYLYLNWFGAFAEDVTININECSITIQYNYYYYDRNDRKSDGDWRYYKIPTVGVEFDDSKIRMKNGIEGIIYEGGGLTDKADFGIKKGEENLIERINKAVAHLATFCPEKKKETF